MSQRQFNMENEQDRKELFALLPDYVEEIYPADGVDGIVLRGHSQRFVIDIFNVKFGPFDCVPRPVDKSKWIGCLCWFWQNASSVEILGILKNIDKKDRHGQPYRTTEFATYANCRPVKRKEIKFVEDGE